ncbi:MAG: hypothetical protein U1D99_09450, partial [Candidatus Omnitrophota bacterium]|nr:hypothetical protein [Candidatus Omnitrophota bacterium]
GTREVDGLVDAPIVPQSFMWTPDSDTPVPVPGVPPGSIIKSPDMTMHSLSGMGPIIKRAAAERGHGPDDVVDAKEMREINYLAKSMIQLEYRRTEKQDDRDFRKEERQDERGWREAQEKKKADRELWEKTYALYGKVANDLEKYSGKRRELARKNRKILARSGPSGDSSWRIPNEAAVPMNLAEGYGLFGVKPSGIVYEDDRGGAGPRMDDGRQLFDDDPDHEALLAEAKKEFPDARTVEVRERGKWRKSIMVTQDGEEYEWVPDKK